MKHKLVLFDLDGVLLDSKPNMARAWQEVRSRLDVKTPFADYFALIGRPFGDIMDRLGLGGRAKEIEGVFHQASLKHMALAQFYDGAERTLRLLAVKGMSLGVVTSKDRSRTDKALAGLNVEFATVRTPVDGYRGKPAPDLLLVAMAQANTDPADMAYVGDMDVDQTAARRAGIKFIHAAWGYGAKLCGCPVARNFDDLAMAVET